MRMFTLIQDTHTHTHSLSQTPTLSLSHTNTHRLKERFELLARFHFMTRAGAGMSWTCTCPVSLRCSFCKHTLAFSIIDGTYQPPEQYQPANLPKDKSRGRPRSKVQKSAALQQEDAGVGDATPPDSADEGEPNERLFSCVNNYTIP